MTPDYPFPSTACLIQARLRDFFEQTGQTKDFNPAAVDLQAACTGYIYALSQAKAYIESGMYRSILIVASEKLSSIVNYQDRSTCVLLEMVQRPALLQRKEKDYSFQMSV